MRLLDVKWTTVALAMFAIALPAQADDHPACDGKNLDRAKDEMQAGLDAYRAAVVNGSAVDTKQLIVALSGFEAACRDGEPMGLAWRAIALQASGQNDAASRALGAFLRIERYSELADADKARLITTAEKLNSSDASIKFAIVNITANVKASIFVGNTLLGTTPLSTLVAGNHVTLTASAPNHQSDTRELDTGDIRPTTVEFHLLELAGSPPSSPTSPPEETRSSSVGPLYAGIGAGVALLAGTAGALWRANRVVVYDGICPTDTSKASGACADTLSQYHVASTIEIAGFITAGVLAAVSGTWWYLDHRGSMSGGKNASAACTAGGCQVGVRF